MTATTWAMVAFALSVEIIVLFSAMRRWEQRRPAIVVAAFMVAIGPSALFALTARVVQQSLTSTAVLPNNDWLRYGLLFSSAWALAIMLIQLPRDRSLERVIPLLLAGMLLSFGATQVYAWELRDSNAYITATALPTLRADTTIDSVPSELDFEANFGQAAVVTNSDWLDEYNRVASTTDTVRTVDPTDITERQLIATMLGLLAAAAVYALASRIEPGASTRPLRVHAVVSLVFLALVMSAVPGSIGTTLPAIVSVAGLSLTLFELTKLIAIVSFALALRAASDGAPRATFAVGATWLGTIALAFTDLGAGLTVGAIGLTMATFTMRRRTIRFGIAVSPASGPGCSRCNRRPPTGSRHHTDRRLEEPVGQP